MLCSVKGGFPAKRFVNFVNNELFGKEKVRQSNRITTWLTRKDINKRNNALKYLCWDKMPLLLAASYQITSAFFSLVSCAGGIRILAAVLFLAIIVMNTKLLS